MTKKIFSWLLFLVFCLFLTRVIELMVIQGRYYRRLAEENRIRELNIMAARGRVLDRNGQELTRNTVKYYQGDKLIDRDQALKLETEGVKLEKKWFREYPLGQSAGQLTGYLGESSKEELSPLGYTGDCPIGFGAWVGRSGVESQYDCQLRGRDGVSLVEVDANGQTLKELGSLPAKAGQDLNLNIDLEIQQIAWQAIAGKKGAVVVLNPQTGAVVALASWPSFDPNVFGLSRDESQIANWLADDNYPFLNRAISGGYHPGSVFKIVTASAGLADGKIDSQTLIEDTGEIRIGQWRFGNWYWLEYGQKEGMVNLVKAIQRSNDIYFYKVGEMLGADTLLRYASDFGVGRRTGIDLPSEIKGLLPEAGKGWFLGNTYHLAIGQGDLTMTPVQVALMTGAVANGGKICQPMVVQKDPVCRQLPLTADQLGLIKEGMVRACSTGGTGFSFFDYSPQVACKTGTAQVGGATDDSHAWFTLFYPQDDPQLVVTVLVERGGSGAYIAGPIAKEIVSHIESRGLR
ncbi:MAG: penicillin-binding transpeptidase domain-containing protein [Patescibacteria group bacterium]